MKKKPIIGIIPDYHPGGENNYSLKPHYAIRENYVSMVSKQDAIAVLIPYDHDSIDDYIELIDGLLLVGGYFDVDPARYGEKVLNETVILNEKRGDFEFKFTEKFLKTNLPILGICNGMQVINVIRGGSLIQDIESEEKDYMIHEQRKVQGAGDHLTGYHEIQIEKDSMLYEILQKSTMKTNSSHHQAVRNVGKNLQINCRAKDSIIEGIEDKSHKFCLGVEWHPEFSIDEGDNKIFKAFVDKCRS